MLLGHDGQDDGHRAERGGQGRQVALPPGGDDGLVVDLALVRRGVLGEPLHRLLVRAGEGGVAASRGLLGQVLRRGVVGRQCGEEGSQPVEVATTGHHLSRVPLELCRAVREHHLAMAVGRRPRAPQGGTHVAGESEGVDEVVEIGRARGVGPVAAEASKGLGGVADHLGASPAPVRCAGWPDA